MNKKQNPPREVFPRHIGQRAGPLLWKNSRRSIHRLGPKSFKTSLSRSTPESVSALVCSGCISLNGFRCAEVPSKSGELDRERSVLSPPLARTQLLTLPQSSLALALLRCIITEGDVFYDGIKTSDINLDALRSKITIIPQIVSLRAI